MWPSDAVGSPAVLAMDTNLLVDVGLLNISWVRVLQHHHLTYNPQHKVAVTRDH